MKSASEELKKLRLMVEKTLIKNDELDKVLAQVEATLARTEARKVSAKNKFTRFSPLDYISNFSLS